MSRIFWDTNIFIYLFEGSPTFGRQVSELRVKMLSRGDQLFTSALTLGEILVKPLREGNTKLAKEYQSAVPSAATLLTFDAAAASVYGKLRCDPGLRAPDAMQLACAATFGVDLFVTNDSRLFTRNVDGIQFIVPLDRIPF